MANPDDASYASVHEILDEKAPSTGRTRGKMAGVGMGPSGDQGAAEGHQ